MRALTFRERMREEKAKAAAAKAVDPWRLTLERVRGKIDFFDRLERYLPDTARSAGGPAAKSDGGHVSASVKTNDRTGWTAVRVRDLRRRLQRADLWVLSRTAPSRIINKSRPPTTWICFCRPILKR